MKAFSEGTEAASATVEVIVKVEKTVTSARRRLINLMYFELFFVRVITYPPLSVRFRVF